MPCFRQESESIMKWLWRNYKVMSVLGQLIEEQAKSTCFVINATPGESIPLCFNCQVLADYAPKISARSIIAITADLGFESLMAISKITKVHRCDMYAPAVWGEMGMNRLVDVHSIRYIYKNTLEMSRDIRNLGHLINKHCNDTVYRKIKERKVTHFFKIKILIRSGDLKYYYSHRSQAYRASALDISEEKFQSTHMHLTFLLRNTKVRMLSTYESGESALIRILYKSSNYQNLIMQILRDVIY